MAAPRSAPEVYATGALPEGFVPVACRFVATRFTRRREHSADDAFSDIPLPSALERATWRRQVEFLAGRHCAREALFALTGRSECPAVGVERDPIWPTHVVGAISHCRGQAAALVGPQECYRGLGLDLERPFSASQSEDLAPLVLTPSERERGCDKARPFFVTLSFSAKESLFKALFPLVRRRFDFTAAELVEWDLRGSAVLRLRIDLGGEWRPGTRFHLRHCRFKGLLLTRVAIPSSRVLQQSRNALHEPGQTISHTERTHRKGYHHD
ncbi:4'-phosphopantetheinyl transferase family protein [Billgrantia endophytica]|uniref:Enterobactin synthase component D n=1 Tax=Billgrantia endophytica TaxID=2033802 RepID=A0A2N7TZJ5_9GAMM|nr:4'-phosphopantetheinyl transferase superfamily protein [Halomonas endophytica]PMR73609.1 phosphopantetheinyl transferase [Halomonas endophytica]